ncbi:leucine-rich repeat domain-containing protein [Clostridium beijerinckii]|uniref:leucine-rich repeat domain-containing protein n=1 Tax=Clostridium beijerinckii TaxID=1520 RepID=UPI001360E27D|nr:leucine-rich repeat domain-containing protein [Clostridium beijerinckii]MZK51697.1 leucine-rich repeat protein [Clostridium beijerinckii]MZK60043.1 leucine-rich repeat protein [Clostridium beijerinckii]MZK70328.1 leucine-rich repeat protein [Clostridium beijerinckii]MZK75561.1 leucine-rich repeat protein [Clostridium beijerinckii]MZK85239.1 leucine-rich repeat protein [Clostridium beijerinckii]
MKSLKLTKVIASALVVASVLMLNPIGANAEWKHNLAGWWYAQGDSWATGWSEIDGKWYHFNSRGYMEHDKTIDGYYLDSSGAWKEVMTTSENLKFDKSTGTIVGYSGVNTVVNIPSEIDGVSVTSIGIGAFSTDNSSAKIESITIPNSVTSIGESAFEWDSNLKAISIPESVKEIGKATFNGCNQLTSVTMPNGLTSIGQGAFSGCVSLTNIKIPDNVIDIGEVAFKGCQNLRSVDIPKSVQVVGWGAFQSCDKLTSINIHRSTFIVKHVFDGSPNVKITIVN